MRKYILSLFLSATSLMVSSQSLPGPGCDEGELVRATERFFAAFNAGDTATLRTMLHPGCIFPDGDGGDSGIGADGFIRSVAGMKERVKYEERIGEVEVMCNGGVGSSRMYYRFYLNGELRHCGENSFHWVRGEQGWRVVSLADTRRKEPCPLTAREQIDSLLDGWHRAAAQADADRYFGAMSYDGIFLGTDATERWERDTFRAWAAPYFERGRAWDFKPYDRHIDFSEDGRVAWFDEKLDTWMDVCRGSGVLVKSEDGWKIRQYNLAVLVPNEKIQDYLAVLAGEDAASLLLRSSMTRLRNARDYTLAVAELMPEEQYGHQPDTSMMSFSEQLIHLARNLGWLTSSFLSEGTNPVRREDASLTDKDSVLAVVRGAYDYALGVMETFPAADLSDTVDFFAGPMTKLQIITLLNDHQTHHRGQLVVYLRTVGIRPPRYIGW